MVPIRQLPDLGPAQVVALQEALLGQADVLREAAQRALAERHIGLARSLAVLGLEESGKAIAVHERRVLIVQLPSTEPFTCERLSALCASHEQKLRAVYNFLVEERYWFGTGWPEANAAVLGAIDAWSKKQSHAKEGRLYVEVSKSGDVLDPGRLTDVTNLQAVIDQIHQIGWQLRLGEHIEGKQQDDLAVGGGVLTHPDYRFFAGRTDPNPFRNMFRKGYEAEARELLELMNGLGDGKEPEIARDS